VNLMGNEFRTDLFGRGRHGGHVWFGSGCVGWPVKVRTRSRKSDVISMLQKLVSEICILARSFLRGYHEGGTKR